MDTRYTLMNKNRAVLDFGYDLETHRVTKLLDMRDVAFAPPAVLDMRGDATRANLDDWWHARAIPASRAQIRRLMSELNISTTLALAERNFGLSLSDRYWIDDPSNPQEWDAINFFDNDFTDDLGLLTLGQDSQSENPDLMSPNSTLGGDLSKKWKIEGSVRVLVKGGSGFISQEVYNEVIATTLHRRLLDSVDFVPYELRREGGRTLCACPNMLGIDEELITAYDIVRNRRNPNTQNDHQFLVSCLESLGLGGIETYLSKMLTCDFIMGNFDRHYRNFGVIRNVQTLEYVRLAPIFDTGDSLWCQAESLDSPEDYRYVAKPFGRGQTPERQLQDLTSFGWFDPDRLTGFSEDAACMLARNPNMPPARIEQVVRGIDWQIGKAVRHIERYRDDSSHALVEDRPSVRGEAHEVGVAAKAMDDHGENKDRARGNGR